MANGVLTAFAMPVSGAGFVGDHVYVEADDGTTWGCHGRNSGGALICTGSGNIDQANCLAQPDGNAGINYLFNGVCHQIANRILYVANPPLLVSQARGYRFYFFKYGAYGREPFGQNYSPTHYPWRELRICNSSHFHPP